MINHEMMGMIFCDDRVVMWIKYGTDEKDQAKLLWNRCEAEEIYAEMQIFLIGRLSCLIQQNTRDSFGLLPFKLFADSTI